MALVLSLLVAGGFVLFAVQEMADASQSQRGKLRGFERMHPTPTAEREREQVNTRGRELVDDANDLLLGPFAGVVDSGSRWAQRGVPTLLGLLVYGFLLGYLARLSRAWG
jgi:hypothetical protein